LAINGSELSALIEQEIQELDSDEARERRRELEEMPRPDVHPSLGRIAADHLGYLYVEEYLLPGEETGAWTIFDPEGKPVATLSLPSDFSVLDIGDDYVLGVRRDELGLEVLELYQLNRPG